MLSDADRIELAKVILRKALSKPRSVEEAYLYCRAEYPLKKSEIKEARRQLGVVSKQINGIQVWSIPEE